MNRIISNGNLINGLSENTKFGTNNSLIINMISINSSPAKIPKNNEPIFFKI